MIPSTIRGLDPDVWLVDRARQPRYVRALFEVVAPRYDRFTRAFSFGMDARWKRELVAMARGGLGRSATVVDLACGTGDLALAVAPLVPQGRVIGVDATPGMVQRAQAQARAAGAGNLSVRLGDMLDLRFLPSGSVDLVTIGYGLRNVVDLDAALVEMRRVLRPGGTLAALEFTLPEPAWWRRLFLAYLRATGDAVGWWWHRDPTVYGYIARSLSRFLTARELCGRLHEHGFDVRTLRTRLGGGVALLTAWRYR